MTLNLHQDQPEFMLPEHIVLLQAYISRLEPGCEQPYLDFACHAAFPLVLTPDLLHHLWVNFSRDGTNVPLDIPWIACADLLLSPLCQPVGGETFEMDAAVRQVLLQELANDQRFGSPRIQELADFIHFYFEASLESDNPSVSESARVQELNAQAHTQPDQTLKKLATALHQSIQSENTFEQLRLAALIEALNSALAGNSEYANILGYAQDRRRVLQGTPVTQLSPITVGGVDLPPVDAFLPVAPPSTAQPAQATQSQPTAQRFASIQITVSLTRTRSAGYELTARLVIVQQGTEGNLPPSESRFSGRFQLPSWYQEWLSLLSSKEFTQPRQLLRPPLDTLGRDLFTAVFTYADSRIDLDWSAIGDAPVKVLIELINAPELEDLPWNFLHDGERYLLERGNVSIVRFEPPPVSHDLSPETLAPHQLPLPLRVLVACVAPLNLDTEIARQEVQAIGDALLPLTADGLLQVETLVNPSYDEFTSSLRQSPASVVYYFGWFETERGVGQSTLAFGARDARVYDQVSMQRFGEALMAVGNPLVFFDGYQRKEGEAYRSTHPATDLLDTGLAAVLVTYGVAMARDQQALLLQSLLRSLASGAVLESALLQSRQALLNDPQNRLGWGLPVLYARQTDYRPFAIQPVSVSAEGAKAELQPENGLFSFNVHIQLTESGDYRLQVLDSPVGIAEGSARAVDADLDIDGFYRNVLRPSFMRTKGGQETSRVHEIGALLFDSLMSGEIGMLYNRSRDFALSRNAGLRIRLQLDEPALDDLPWEFLYDLRQDQFLALSANTSILRYLEMPTPVPPLSLARPLRMLVIIPTARDLVPIDETTGREILDRSLAKLVDAGLLELDYLSPASVPALQSKLTQQEYHILSYTGQGQYDDRSFQSRLAFVDEEGGVVWINTQNLGRLLAEHGTLRLVVSDASATGHRRRFNAGMAADLLMAGVPCLVTFQGEISNAPSFTFVETFYERLLAGSQPVDLALADTRRAIYASGNQTEWGVPVLYARSADLRLFTLHAEAAPTPDEAPTQAAQPVESPAAVSVMVQPGGPGYHVFPFQGQEPASDWESFVDVNGNQVQYRRTVNRQTLYAQYSPTLPVPGQYYIEVFIPAEHATTGSAQYTVIHHREGQRLEARAILDQSDYSNTWASLGSFSLDPQQDGSGRVTLIDLTRDRRRKEIAFSTVRWTLLNQEPGIPSGPDTAENINPYVGARPFTGQDARFFFGGESSIQEIIKRLSDEPLLIVTGPAGSGKTSLIQAGLLPALEKGALPGSQDWVLMTARPGDQPLENLALTVEPERAGSEWLPEAVRRLRSDPAYLSKLVLERYQSQRTFWFIDNLEELFTVTRDTALQQDYLEVVLQLAGQGNGVIMGIKVEYLGQLLNLPAGKALERSIFTLAPRKAEELRTVIERPAQQAGITLEEALVDELIKDVSREPNPLAVVQAVLHALYEASPKDQSQLTLQDYHRLGGVRGILGQSNQDDFSLPA